jgi:C_GCAxxG_C_C family probable redox protein
LEVVKDKVNDIKEKAFQLGFEYEKTYYGCGQCVVAAMQDALDIPNEAVFKAASGFAGGIGLAGDSACGAYAGAVMVLSSILGRERDNFADPEKVRFKSFDMAKRLHDKFTKELGAVNCHAIHAKLYGRPYWLWDNDDRKKFDDAGGHSHKCPEVCGLAAKWAIEILEEENLV